MIIVSVYKESFHATFGPHSNQKATVITHVNFDEIVWTCFMITVGFPWKMLDMICTRIYVKLEADMYPTPTLPSTSVQG
jgi:hypothetical protein